MLHLDLFSGIGGFAYAADQVWDNVEHIFCDNDPFCQKVLDKHWKGSTIYGDIRQLITDTDHGRSEKQEKQTAGHKQYSGESPFILTGGFPCQPFSAAGVRKGTNDERYLWPAMFEVIQFTKPEWVIAENVRGLLTWEDGLVFEQVCSDLETAGYEVQAFIIPAVAVNAPHRRDRIWFVAHSSQSRTERIGRQTGNERRQTSKNRGESLRQGNRPTGSSGSNPADKNATDSRSPESRGLSDEQPRQEVPKDRSVAENSISQRSSGRSENGRQILGRKSTEDKTEGSDSESRDATNADNKRLQGSKRRETLQARQTVSYGPAPERSRNTKWEKDWLEVATEFCSVDDGLPVELGEFKLSKARHRAEQLKAYGNAIVPQVAIEIMEGIKLADEQYQKTV